MVTATPSAHRDRGAVLVLTLILSVVLAAVGLALANYVMVGLRSADVASERTETNVDSANVLSWAVEQFAKKQFLPDDDCGEAPTYLSLTVPSALMTNGSVTTLECAQTEPIAGEPVVHLIATSTGNQTRVVEATVEVPRYTHGARVSDWRVDIPINVPAFVPTTSSTPSTSSTSTTSTTAANTPPTARPTSWFVTPNSTTTVFLDADDVDGTIVSASITGLPGTWSAPATGTSVSLTVDGTAGTYSLTYTVTDDDGATASSTLSVEVTGTPPSTSTTTTTTTTSTTTTTLAPNPSCTFTVTSSSSGGNSGIGNLAISNSGGAFTGWQVQLTQMSSSKPWQFTWDQAVTATVGSQYVVVSGSQTIAQGGTFNVSANLVQSGNPKIVQNDTLTCVVLSP